jgi:hypothetical protein
MALIILGTAQVRNNGNQLIRVTIFRLEMAEVTSRMTGKVTAVIFHYMIVCSDAATKTEEEEPGK